MTKRGWKTAPIALTLLLVIGFVPSASGQPSELERMRGEANRLEAQLERQGARLSMAQEDYNHAVHEREVLEGQLQRVRRDLAAAEEKWHELKAQLGSRARNLYKRPGVWVGSLLEVRSLGDLVRARTLAGSVLKSDTELLYETDNARREMAAVAEEVSALRAVAVQKERELAGRRVAVERELRGQQALLQEVRGELTTLIEQQRQRELAEARRRAAAEEARRQAAQTRAAAAPPQQTSGTTPSSGGISNPNPPRAPRASANQAVAAAASQIGKRYCWGGTGPDCYDCSGLTQWAWAQAGVSIPRSSRAQYAGLPKVPRDQIQPGDLLFFGNPIHHVGIYEGNGVMIEAPYTGENVRRRSINRSDWAGAARP